jgi:small subunit ribosomal protein S10
MNSANKKGVGASATTGVKKSPVQKPAGSRTTTKTILKIKLSSHNINLLNSTVKSFVSSLKKVWSKYSGPIPLPTDIEKFTVNRSPHVYKKSQEQFEIRTHSILIVLRDPNHDVIQSISGIELPSGVNVKIKVENY